MNETPMNNSSESDWARVDAMRDEEIDTSDIPPLPDAFFRRARVRMPKQQATIQIDADCPTAFRTMATTNCEVQDDQLL